MSGQSRGHGTSKGHSLDSFHYTLPGNPLNELKGSLLPLATPANAQLWPTNSGQLARVGIVINQLMPLSCKRHFQLWRDRLKASVLVVPYWTVRG